MPRYDLEWDETIGGKIFPKYPDPTNHNFIKGNLTSLFINYLREQTAEYFASVGVFLEDGEIYMPDGALVTDPRQVKEDGIHGAPDLVVEILSWKTVRHDRGHKKDVYERCGVGEYWIISPEERFLERYLLQNGKFALRDVYCKYPFHDFECLDPEERDAIITEFRCAALPELLISTDDVFEGVRRFPDETEGE
ncbi:MAG: Uma2 family endonuclease [Oscillibacter sp.]|nr:Uma2 family endonuclease [Oscillibacter sp.]